MAAEKTLDDLFLHTVKDVYWAEKNILKALPKMSKAAKTPALKKAFDKHKSETEGQIARLEKVFAMLGRKPAGVKCDAMAGLLEEGKGAIEEFGKTEAGDAAILGAAQAVEHYEIARYGTLKAWAMQLGMADAAKLFDATLKEEKACDADLSKLAEGQINADAEN